MEFIREFFAFIRARKRYWLIPLISMLLLLSMLIIFAQGSALAPFIYSIF